jgi:hypothetical protein
VNPISIREFIAGALHNEMVGLTASSSDPDLLEATASPASRLTALDTSRTAPGYRAIAASLRTIRHLFTGGAPVPEAR